MAARSLAFIPFPPQHCRRFQVDKITSPRSPGRGEEEGPLLNPFFHVLFHDAQHLYNLFHFTLDPVHFFQQPVGLPDIELKRERMVRDVKSSE